MGRLRSTQSKSRYKVQDVCVLSEKRPSKDEKDTRTGLRAVLSAGTLTRAPSRDQGDRLFRLVDQLREPVAAPPVVEVRIIHLAMSLDGESRAYSSRRPGGEPMDHLGVRYHTNPPRFVLTDKSGSKIQRTSKKPGGCKNTFLSAFETLVILALKLYFVCQLIRFVYTIPHMSTSHLPIKLFEISELILSLAAVAGADCIWSSKTSVRRLLHGRFFQGSHWRSTGAFGGTWWPLCLFGHAIFGVSLFFAANVCPWTPEGIARCSLWETFSKFFFVNLLALAQTYMAITIYTVLCLNVKRKMAEVVQEIKGTRNVLSYEGLRRLHHKWEQCASYVEELSLTFLGFVCIWYCYLFVRAVYVISTICKVIDLTGATVFNRQQMCVPIFELTFLIILCVVSEKVKSTMLESVDPLKELTMSRASEEVQLHAEVQRFLYRIEKYSDMTLWKFPMWTENAMKVFLVVIVGLIMFQDRRVRSKLC
ncbi:uncharacterized protein LOC8043325 [Ixodes scapularis]|uniref:uncharacterized protein LOC8043325 n=1 Tax=Ixodes scapularis TaxID=6945 RepID=UPI001A9D3D97|nr:uncharacterized protein LOC8043325 [Ixodes scapularis]